MEGNGKAAGVVRKRRPYTWGKKKIIAGLEVDIPVRVPYKNVSNYGAWRSLASRLGQEYGMRIAIVRDENELVLIRLR